MITKVAIKNFKCLQDVHVDLERFTVFVGPNASGKSSILQGLNLLCLAFRSANPMHPFAQFPAAFLDQNVEVALTQSLSRGTKGPVEVSAESGGSWYRYRTRSIPTSENPVQMSQSEWNGDGLGTAAAPDSKVWKPWKPEQNRDISLPLSVLLAFKKKEPSWVSPCERSHELTAGKDNQALRSSKRVLRHLSGGDWARERLCWTNSPLLLLRERGGENGLATYMKELRDRLTPFIGHIAEA